MLHHGDPQISLLSYVGGRVKEERHISCLFFMSP
jgi:hypothetical protein